MKNRRLTFTLLLLMGLAFSLPLFAAKGQKGPPLRQVGQTCDARKICATGLVCLNGVCQAPVVCGDGVCSNSENCTSCASDCGACPFCGDGKVNQGSEECDDGNTNNFDSCRNDCTRPFCGDGILDSGEACDDGNTVNTDGCTNACKLPTCGDTTCSDSESCSSCSSDCGACPPVCGDGTCSGAETCATCSGDCGVCPDPGVTANPLKDVTTWMYQIQRLDWTGQIEALEATNYQMLVLEPTYTDPGSGWTTEDARNMVNRLRVAPNGKERILLAYIDIGEAEEWRYYWESWWVAPTRTSRGNPDFMVTVDPDGWTGNYPVAYWDVRWKKIWLGEGLTGPGGLIQELVEIGFDGVYLDWVEAYDDTAVMKVAQEDGVHAADEMVKFIHEIRSAGKALDETFLVVQQNAQYLLDHTTDKANYLAAIDAEAAEGVWFQGDAGDNWNDPKGGDIPNSWTPPWDTESLIAQLHDYLSEGKPVFTVDYCLDETNAYWVYATSSAEGFKPLVTRVCLCGLTQTPPPWLQ